MSRPIRRHWKERRSGGRRCAVFSRSAWKNSAGVSTRAAATGIEANIERLVGFPGPVAYIPTVIENEGGNRERAFDIYSRLLRDRVIMLGRPIDDTVANLIVAQLIFLAADDPEKEIQIYVNSPGGSVAAGFAIYDTMQYVPAPVSTVAVGRAASFGTVLLMAGAKGRRLALPNARIHMHQPLITGRGLQGQASDLDIHAREIIRIKDELNKLIAAHTGQPLERIERDTDRDYFLSPEEAIEYGLIDGVIGSL